VGGGLTPKVSAQVQGMLGAQAKRIFQVAAHKALMCLQSSPQAAGWK
jgi:hypothetical protein